MKQNTIKDTIIELTIDDLELVSGGSVQETADDTQYLYDAGLMSERLYPIDFMFWNWTENSAKVDAGWARAGITCVTKYIGINEYYYQGRQITQNEARTMISRR